jgi:hypothetical protein
MGAEECDQGSIGLPGKGMGKEMRVAILDNYQNLALKMADWSRVSAQAEITTFNDRIDNLESPVARLYRS